MEIINAPNDWNLEDGKIKCFLAGGLQKCNWHDTVLNYLKNKETSNLVLFNPKRDDFDIGNQNMEYEQISWEFQYLNTFKRDKDFFFSIFFDASESVQPICFYELGRMLAILQPEQCVVSVHPRFSRRNDVIIQTELATAGEVPVLQVLPEVHAERIYEKYKNLI